MEFLVNLVSSAMIDEFIQFSRMYWWYDLLPCKGVDGFIAIAEIILFFLIISPFKNLTVPANF